MKIIERLGNIPDFFKSNLSHRTALVKIELFKLGHELNYKVYANRLNSNNIREITNNPNNGSNGLGKKVKSKEWLFDLHWYTEKDNNHYFPLKLPLVVECEWKHKRYGANDANDKYGEIKYDFQKLIISNAELRLMIFEIKNIVDLDSSLQPYFQNVINYYIHLEKNAKFLFVAFYKAEKTFYYKELRKQKI